MPQLMILRVVLFHLGCPYIATTDHTTPIFASYLRLCTIKCRPMAVEANLLQPIVLSRSPDDRVVSARLARSSSPMHHGGQHKSRLK